VSAAPVVTAALVISNGLDGRTRYHYRGAVLHDVHDEEVQRLVDAGLVEHREVVDVVIPAVVGAPVVPTEPIAPVVSADGTQTYEVALERPAQVAPKEAWVAYAVGNGKVTEAEAAELTKADLIELVKD
jgi:hypothetical protein